MESQVDWEAELGGGAVGCWDGGGVGGACVSGRSLRPPPLFRSISPTGVSAGLPPHRRLRTIFRRSRAVLPTDTRVRGDPFSQTRGRVDTPARTPDLTGAPSPISGLSLRAVPANAHLWKPTVLNRQCGGRPCLQPVPSPRTRLREGRGGGAGAVSPDGQGDGPGSGATRTEERKVRKRRRRREGKKEKYPGNECRGLPAQGAGREGDRALCSWLESLGLTDTPTVTATANHQSRTPQEGGSAKWRVGPRERGAEPNHRDRRPYFLPPICQSGSLLDVPLLLPENSPPPSPCSSPDGPTFPLPVPLLHPLPPKRK